MFYQKKNQYGVISVDDTIIKQIIETSVKSFNGKVLLSNKKGQIFDSVKIWGVNDSNNYFDFNDSEKGYEVNLYIIVKFGFSLTVATNTIINNLYNCINGDLGLYIQNINVIVKGIQTNKAISKRNLVYSKFPNNPEE